VLESSDFTARVEDDQDNVNTPRHFEHVIVLRVRGQSTLDSDELSPVDSLFRLLEVQDVARFDFHRDELTLVLKKEVYLCILNVVVTFEQARALPNEVVLR
jgi:hypothetical protein